MQLKELLKDRILKTKYRQCSIFSKWIDIVEPNKELKVQKIKEYIKELEYMKADFTLEFNETFTAFRKNNLKP